MSYKYYQVRLPYYQQGDDMYNSLEIVLETQEDENVFSKEITPYLTVRAFLEHSERMEVTARILRDLANYSLDYDITIVEANDHHVVIVCDKEIGDRLVEEELVYELELEEDSEHIEEEQIN